jgi:hypothetical protein
MNKIAKVVAGVFALITFIAAVMAVIQINWSILGTAEWLAISLVSLVLSALAKSLEV